LFDAGKKDDFMSVKVSEEGVMVSRSGHRSRSRLHAVLAKAREELRPVNISCELTYRCNIDCLHCYCVRDDGKEELTTRQWKEFLSHTAEEKGFYLTFTGGEILVRSDFFDLFEHARSLGFLVKLKTNATLITDVVADRIAALHPLVVDVSILGGGDKIHDSITRVRGSHEKAWRGVERLRARSVPVDVRTSIMESNVQSYTDLKMRARSLGCSTNCDVNLFPKNDADISVQEGRLEEDDFRKFLNTLTLENPLGRKKSRDEKQTLMCGAGRGNFSIDPYGNITTCNPLQLPLGNAKTDRWEDVRRSRLLNRIVAMTLGDLPECRNCDYRHYCDRCHAMAFLESGSLVKKSVQACKMAKMVKWMAEQHEKEHRESAHV
jgi:radical SAM protein with 4Fe4S-binding SPASM domain